MQLVQQNAHRSGWRLRLNALGFGAVLFIQLCRLQHCSDIWHVSYAMLCWSLWLLSRSSCAQQRAWPRCIISVVCRWGHSYQMDFSINISLSAALWSQQSDMAVLHSVMPPAQQLAMTLMRNFQRIGAGYAGWWCGKLEADANSSPAIDW